jgi:hypothetical protein
MIRHKASEYRAPDIPHPRDAFGTLNSYIYLRVAEEMRSWQYTHQILEHGISSARLCFEVEADHC